MRRAFLSLLVIGVVSIGALSQEVPAGFGAGSFARIGVDARPLAMGGTGVAIATGHPIPYYNPARLVGAAPFTTGGMYSEPYGQDLGVSFQSLSAIGGFGVQTDSSAGIGAAITWIQMKIDDIPVWDEDDPGQVTLFTATSSLYLASGAVWALPDVAVGVTAKVYRERILEGRGNGIGFDVGLLASFDLEGIPVTAGVNAMDVGSTNVRWHGTIGEPDNFVPWVNKIGVSVSLFDEMVLVAGDFDWAVGRPGREQKIHVGVEANPIGPLYVRAGWSGDLEGSDSKLSAGLGVEFFDSFRLDYAYVPPRTIFGTGHFLSIHLSLPFSGVE
ncbi:MAG: hypothetical protein WBC63_06175 [Candidatus Bipolaricaulia bacterium]